MLRKMQHVKCILRATSDGWQSLYARDPIPPPRGRRLALGSVSFIVDTIRAFRNITELDITSHYRHNFVRDFSLTVDDKFHSV